VLDLQTQNLTMGSEIDDYSTETESQRSFGAVNFDKTRIPRTMAMQIKVRDFVRGRCMNRQRVTGCQVLDFLVAEKHLVVPLDLISNPNNSFFH
jgi:very-short-patch-repair endonuclease